MILGFPSIAITDSTSVGRSVLTAASAAAGATALGVGTGDTVTFAGLLVSDLTSGRVPRASTSGRLVNSAYDTGSAFGYGVSPSYLAHFKNDTNATIFFTTDNASTGASAAAGFAGISNSAFVSVKAYGSGNAMGTYCEVRASAGYLAYLMGATERFRMSAVGNLWVAAAAEPASLVGGLVIGNGTAPSSTPADQITIFSVDAAAGEATLGLRTEAAVVTESLTSDRSLKVNINGTVYKFCLKA